MSQRLQSATMVLRTLRLLERRSPLGVTAVAREMHIPTSSAHRILHTLLTEGFARQTSSKCYELVPGIIVTAPQELLGALIAAAEPEVRYLSDRTGMTAELAVLIGQGVRIILAFESGEPLSTESYAGRELPAHTSAAGKALLARKSVRELRGLYWNRALEKPTDAALDNLDDLLAHLSEVQVVGYARDLSESAHGERSIAVAAQASGSRMPFALVINGPASDADSASVGELSAEEASWLEVLKPAVIRITEVVKLV